MQCNVCMHCMHHYMHGIHTDCVSSWNNHSNSILMATGQAGCWDSNISDCCCCCSCLLSVACCGVAVGSKYVAAIFVPDGDAVVAKGLR